MYLWNVHSCTSFQEIWRICSQNLSKHRPVLKSCYSLRVCPSNAKLPKAKIWWRAWMIELIPIAKYTPILLYRRCATHLGRTRFGVRWWFLARGRQVGGNSSFFWVVSGTDTSQQSWGDSLGFKTATQNSHCSHGFSHLRNTMQRRRFLCLLWGAPPPHPTNEAVFPRRFIHPNVSLLCVLHAALLFVCICWSALPHFNEVFPSRRVCRPAGSQECFNETSPGSRPRYTRKLCKEPIHKPSEFQIPFFWQLCLVEESNHLLSRESAWTFGVPKTESSTNIYRGYTATKASKTVTSVPCTRSQHDTQ